MSELVTYACDVNSCQQMTQKAISFDFGINEEGIYIFKFDTDPKMFSNHACSFKHLVEYFAQETDKIERSKAHGK